ncbi:DoxX family membrane protein [Propioniciclava tarda]|uniref:DoxX family membrane protein n=1 Tax=Propioniciclava tarda TaxID=433330 RepID=A0A4V2JT75_PROTD|nr:DoxX family membrane protein [Propioniciclava tarda]TBT95171.1 DoxX family membrane protein [Propioniciclava tarda]SMO51585.1 DoxX protein [Propioniciclava tarda]
MNLLRGAGRAMMATYFIANGVKALRDPDALVPATEPIAQRFVPFAQKTLPEAVSAYVPEDTRSLVRLGGVASIAGGLGMATGIAPRGGGVLAAASMLPHLVAADPRQASDRRGAMTDFFGKLAIAGAALVVSQDTRGRPSLLWRAGDSAARLGRTTTRAVDGAQADAVALSRRARKNLDKAARQAQRRFDAVAEDVKGVLQ